MGKPPKGRTHGRRPKLSPAQAAEVLRVYRAENWRSAPDIAAQFGISRATVYRILAKEMRDK